MASLAAATSLSLPPAPPAQLLDIQSLPSLEKFDSQLLDLIKATNDASAQGINVMDELQAPDDDLALQRLMSLTGNNKSLDIFSGVMQQQLDAAAAAQQDNVNAQRDAAARRAAAAANHQLRGQLQHHTLASGGPPHPHPQHTSDPMAALAEFMRAQQQQQQQQTHLDAAAAGGFSSSKAQADYMNFMMGQGQMGPQAMGQDYTGPTTPQTTGLQGSASLADALAGLSSGPNSFNALVESLRAEGVNLAGNYGGNLSAALSSLGLPPVDGPSSAVAQRKRANRGTRLTDIIKVEQSSGEEDGGPIGDHDSLSAAAAAMAAALAAGGGSDSRDSTQSPHAAKRRRGAGGQSAEAAAAAAAAAALGSADSDYEGELHSTSHLHITADMDEDTKTRLRREKNRIAARKCRAKKNALMTDLQATLAGLMRKNEEYKLQMVTWHKMFSREVRLREAMKRIIAVMWQNDVAPAATGYTANDIILGIESGTLDINSVVRSFAAVTAASNGAATPLQANHASLASPAPLVLNRSTSAAAAAAAAAAAGTPRSPAAAAAAAAAAEAAMAAAAAEGESPVQGLVPQHLLMSHSSHISSTSEQGAAASLVLNAANGLATGGVGAAADANCLGSPIPSVAAAALVDLAGGAGQQGFGGLADAPWGWGMEGGMGGAPQVGPSCITTGME